MCPVIEVLVKPGDTVQSRRSPDYRSNRTRRPWTFPRRRGDRQGIEGSRSATRSAKAALILLLDSAAATPPGAPTPPSVSPPPAPVSSHGGVADVRVPDIGDFKDVPVIEILVKPGDTVKAEDALITLESDKATLDVPAPLGGVVRELKVQVGEKVSEGTIILTLATGAEQRRGGTGGGERGSGRAHARGARRGRALGWNRRSRFQTGLRRAGGAQAGARAGRRSESGPGQWQQRPYPQGGRGALRQGRRGARRRAEYGRRRRCGARSAGLAQVDFSKFGPVESQPRSRIKKISAANLHRNWVMIPHVTNHDEADITDLEAFRVQLNQEIEKSGVKVSMLSFLIKAAVATLKKFPEFNASLDGDNLILKQYYHIGFAADTPNGLVVPVLRDADQKGVVEIAKEMGELAKLAREGKLKPDQMQGGTFTISSLGGIGGTYFTPIINAPGSGDHGGVPILLEAGIARRQDNRHGGSCCRYRCPTITE